MSPEGCLPRRPLFRLGAELLVVYVLPVAFIKAVWGDVFFFHFRAFMAFFVFWAIGTAVYGRLSGLSFSDMGFTRSLLVRSLLLNALVTVAAIGAVFWLAGPRLLGSPHLPRNIWFPLFYVFLSCPAQELLYRGLAFPLMERGGIRSGAALVVVSAILYASLHLFFTKPFIIPLTFLIGLGWGTIYLFVRNLWGLILSHALVGMLAIMAGLA